MSLTSVEAVNAASSIDWQSTAAFIGTLIATIAVTVLGWLQGRKKIDEKVRPGDGVDIPIAAGIIQDNQTIRESTLVSKEVRDQLLLMNHNLQQFHRDMEEACDLLGKLMREMRRRAEED